MLAHNTLIVCNAFNKIFSNHSDLTLLDFFLLEHLKKSICYDPTTLKNMQKRIRRAYIAIILELIESARQSFIIRKCMEVNYFENFLQQNK